MDTLGEPQAEAAEAPETQAEAAEAPETQTEAAEALETQTEATETQAEAAEAAEAPESRHVVRAHNSAHAMPLINPALRVVNTLPLLSVYGGGAKLVQGEVVAAPAPVGAEQIMSAPLPPHWNAAQDPQTGRTYYQNHMTEETQWDPPVEVTETNEPGGENLPDAGRFSATYISATPPAPVQNIQQVAVHVGTATSVAPPQAPGQTMVQAIVPAGKVGGETMQVHTTRGLMQVVIPQGLQAGQYFQFSLPDERGKNGSSATYHGVPAGQLPAQLSMTNPMNRTNSILGANAEVHPLVEKLEAGLKIYSQSFWDDAWLTFKNSHIVLSCITVHPAHHFTANERSGVLVTSLFVAFGLSAILDAARSAGGGKQDSIANSIAVAIASFLLQYAYDYFAEVSVKCSCVQRSKTCIKNTFECIGKFAFCYLSFIAVAFFVSGIAILIEVGGNAVVALATFGATRLFNFIFSSSVSHMVFFWYGRRSQMKPSADVLATDEGRKKWTTKSSLCKLTPQAPCDMWDRHIGSSLEFHDLPLHAPDYDWDVKIKMCCCACSPIYEHKAKNPEQPLQVRPLAHLRMMALHYVIFIVPFLHRRDGARSSSLSQHLRLLSSIVE